MTDLEIFTALGAATFPQERDQLFAASLRGWFERRRYFTEPQSAAAQRMLERLARQAAPTTEAAPAVASTGDLRRIRELFTIAGSSLRRPAIAVPLPSEIEVYTVRDPSTIRLSQRSGYLAVTENRAGRDALYYGRIDEQGAFLPTARGRRWEATLREGLAAFAADPAGVASAYGRRTGQCCFCMHPLTDARSVAVGYGPVCAGNYHLPWGEAGAAEQAARTEARVTVRAPRRPRAAALALGETGQITGRDLQAGDLVNPDSPNNAWRVISAAEPMPRRRTRTVRYMMAGDMARYGIRQSTVTCSQAYTVRRDGPEGVDTLVREAEAEAQRRQAERQARYAAEEAQRRERQAQEAAERAERMRPRTGAVTFTTVTDAPNADQRRHGWLD